jgi:hypothetical protein
MTHRHRMIFAVLTLLLAPIAAQAADLCAAKQPPDLQLTVRPGAMIQVSVSAPCAPNTRAVLHHAGLAVTLLTSDQGTLLVWLPALSPLALVDISLPDGSTIQETVAVPEVHNFDRFGVQWQGQAGFRLEPAPNDLSGKISRLGDARAALPMLAQIYSRPHQPGVVALGLQLPVQPENCGNRILGETLEMRAGGPVQVVELSQAVAECSHIGGTIVLPPLFGALGGAEALSAH